LKRNRRSVSPSLLTPVFCFDRDLLVASRLTAIQLALCARARRKDSEALPTRSDRELPRPRRWGARDSASATYGCARARRKDSGALAASEVGDGCGRADGGARLPALLAAHPKNLPLAFPSSRLPADSLSKSARL